MIDFNITKKNASFSIINFEITEESLPLVKKLDEWTSAFVDGYQWMPSYRAGFSDGKTHLCKSTSDGFIVPNGLLKRIVNNLKKYSKVKINYTSEFEEKKFNITLEEFKEFVNTLKLPFEPYDYQLQIAYDLITKNKISASACTSSGKSYAMYLVSRFMLEHNLKTVIIVPSVLLTLQLYDDFISYGFENIEESVHKIGGETSHIKHFEKPITITTWQSIQRSSELFSDVDCLQIDECHGMDGNILKNVVIPSTINTSFRIGLSGTLKSSDEFLLLLESYFGEPIVYVTIKDLISRGLATDVLISFLFLNYDEKESRKVLAYKKYESEVKHIIEQEGRNNFLGKFINKVSTKGNTLVLFDRVKHGEVILEKVFNNMFPDEEFNIKNHTGKNSKHGIFFMTGSMKGTDRDNIRKLLETENNNILFGTSSILSTGVSIKNLHNLVFISSGKSEQRIPQSIGRLVRKMTGKFLVHVYDIVDDFRVGKKKNYTYKHFEQRLQIYEEQGFNTDEREIKISSD